MPTPARIADHTQVLTPPDDWDEERNGHCGQLFIRHELQDGVNFMRSAWEMAPDEALMLLTGAKILLGISGTRHPVVNLQVAQLPADFETAYSARRYRGTDGGERVRVEGLHAHDGAAKRLYCERLIGQDGIAVAIAQAVDAIEELVDQNGWRSE